MYVKKNSLTAKNQSTYHEKNATCLQILETIFEESSDDESYRVGRLFKHARYLDAKALCVR